MFYLCDKSFYISVNITHFQIVMHISHFPQTEVGIETRDLQLVKERAICSLAVVGIACRLALVSISKDVVQFKILL